MEKSNILDTNAQKVLRTYLEINDSWQFRPDGLFKESLSRKNKFETKAVKGTYDLFAEKI